MFYFNTPAARAFANAGEAARAFKRARALVNVARIRRARGADPLEVRRVVNDARLIARWGRDLRRHAMAAGVLAVSDA